jgi:predicted secreted protein
MRSTARALILAVSLGTAGCAFGPKAPVALAAADSGQPLQLAVGQQLTLTLVSNHTTGYRWVWMNPVNPVLRQVGDAVYQPSQSALEGMTGGGGTERWTFEATAPGKTTLQVEYRRPWSMQTPALKTLRYPVTVK